MWNKILRNNVGMNLLVLNPSDFLRCWRSVIILRKWIRRFTPTLSVYFLELCLNDILLLLVGLFAIPYILTQKVFLLFSKRWNFNYLENENSKVFPLNLKIFAMITSNFITFSYCKWIKIIESLLFHFPLVCSHLIILII